jgi:hypothetical protein
MIEYIELLVIGLAAGILGGMIGIGGAMVIIPALILFRGPDQHLYQAAAMICTFFVSGSSAIVHRKESSFVLSALKWIIPFALFGVIVGVAISNLPIFKGPNSYLLSRIFGLFLVYVVVYNLIKLKRDFKNAGEIAMQPYKYDNIIAVFVCGAIGFFSAVISGLLGIGAGGILTPLQQFFLKLRLKNAMSNSAAVIVSAAVIGSIYKNLTLPMHGYQVTQSLKLAAFMIPTAIIGGYLGGKLMHFLPQKIVRIVFILVMAAAAIKMLTVTPNT